MQRPAILCLLGIVACEPAAVREPVLQSAAQPTATTSAAPAPVTPPVAPKRRRVECDLEKAVATFLAGQEVEQCGTLGYQPASADYERARACVLAAQKAQRPFVVIWNRPSVDSIMRYAYAGKLSDEELEVRYFRYDDCCGLGPHWSSVRCQPLVDSHAACEHRKGTVPHPHSELFCSPDGTPYLVQVRTLELFCFEENDVYGCSRTAR